MFNSIIPLPYYTPIFYNVILVLVLIVFMNLKTKGYIIRDLQKKNSSIVLFLFVVLYMGLRPISFHFMDMGLYNHTFQLYAEGKEVSLGVKDFWWNSFVKFCSGFMTAKVFFLLCAFLYVTPLYIAVKKWFKNDSYFMFLMLIASFSFWAYGTNGIRNGIATSIFVLAITYSKNSLWKYLLLIISYLVHGSMIIPIAAFVLTSFYKNPKHYLFGWFSSILISLVVGGLLESFFLSLGFGGERASYLTMNEFDDQFSSTGFRWDFLLYSGAAVFAGFYFILKKNFNDKIYIQLFNIYLTANAFWILVIRASFSNRFAYMSWFLMAIVIFYPFFKQQFFKHQHKVLAFSMLIYFGFTYLMFLLK